MTKKLEDESCAHVGKVLGSVLGREKFSSDRDIYKIANLWCKIAGKQIADNTKPFAVENSMLLVYVSNSVWLYQLISLKKELLEKTQYFFKDNTLNNIIFKIGPV